MDMPRRTRSNGRHGSGSRSLRALKPMKHMRVSASPPPASATGAFRAEVRHRPDWAGASGQTVPARPHARDDGTQDAVAADDDGRQAFAPRETTYRQSASKHAKYSVRSSDAAVTMPKRSSLAL